MTDRLLVISCSSAKQHAHGPMPAIERYDGPAFRMLRKALTDGVIGPDTTIRIISAKYGLISGGAWLHDYVHDYNQRMTLVQAKSMASSVTAELLKWFWVHPECDGVFVNVGRDYAPALAGLGDYCGRHSIPYAEAAGNMGQRLAQMKAWLVGR